MPDACEGRRFGSVAFIGRPNAGKSTLMNRLVAQKVAIVSDKPQTTRQRMVGILTGDRGQMVFYDTPGIHKPLHRLNREMVRRALESLDDADVVCLLVDASVPMGRGDRYLLDLLERTDGPRVLALNKIDAMPKERLLPRIQAYAEEGLFEEIVPVSALTGDGCDRLLGILWDLLAEGEPIYDPDLATVHPVRFLVAERIREKVLRHTRDELPFATAVRIDLWAEPESGDVLRIAASVLVDRPSQKKIVIGAGGSMIRTVGTEARLDLQDLLGRRVYLELHVRVAPGWREDRRILASLDAWSDLDGGSG